MTTQKKKKKKKNTHTETCELPRFIKSEESFPTSGLLNTPVVAHQLSYGALRIAEVFPRKSIPALLIFFAGVSDSSGF